MSSKFDNIFGIDEETTKALEQAKQKEENKADDVKQMTVADSNSQAWKGTLDAFKDGTVKNTLKNINLIMQNDPAIKGTVKYNLASQETKFVKPVKFPKLPNLTFKDIPAGPVTDKAVNRIVSYISSNPDYNINTSKDSVLTALDVAAQAQSYDPLVDYFDKLKWDGKDRISNCLHDFLGAEKTPANILAFKHWLMCGVAKVYNKDAKVDECLDLVGGQGVGKTSLFDKITPLHSMYVQGFHTLTDKDDLSMMVKGFIVNDDEMTASARASFEVVKNFITQDGIDFRSPYGHAVEHYHQSFIFCRTSNEIQHLADKTGDRRFMSIECGVDNKKYDVNDESKFTKDYVNQIWAQAKALYDKANGSIKLTCDEYKLLEEGRQRFLKTSDLEDTINDMIDNELANSNFISNEDMRKLLREKLQRNVGNKDMSKVRYYLVNSTKVKWQAGAKGYVNGTQKRGFKRAKQIVEDPQIWNVQDWIESEINNRLIVDKFKTKASKLASESHKQYSSINEYWNDINKVNDNKADNNNDNLPL